MNSKLLVSLIVLLVVSVFSMAPETKAQDSDNTQWLVGGGFDFGLHSYDETNSFEENGIMGGAHAFLRRNGSFMIGLDLSMDRGLTTFKMSGLEFDKIESQFVEGRLLFGKDFSSESGKTITPYIGLGVRWWDDFLSSVPGAFNTNTRYLYLPIGAELKMASGEESSGQALTISAEVDILIKGRQQSDLMDVGFMAGDTAFFYTENVENDQESGMGIKGAVGYQLPIFGGSTMLHVEAFVQYWKISRSELTGTIIDGYYIDEDDLMQTFERPINGFIGENTTLQFGLKVSFFQL